MTKIIIPILAVLLTSCDYIENNYYEIPVSQETPTFSTASAPTSYKYDNGRTTLKLNGDLYSFTKGASVVFYQDYVELRFKNLYGYYGYVTIKASDCAKYRVVLAKGFVDIEDGIANVSYDFEDINVNIPFNSASFVQIGTDAEFHYDVDGDDWYVSIHPGLISGDID